jgi:hypothetical protein
MSRHFYFKTYFCLFLPIGIYKALSNIKYMESSLWFRDSTLHSRLLSSYLTPFGSYLFTLIREWLSVWISNHQMSYLNLSIYGRPKIQIDFHWVQSGIILYNFIMRFKTSRQKLCTVEKYNGRRICILRLDLWPPIEVTSHTHVYLTPP